MAENIAVVCFKVESEAFQALTELKNSATNDSFIVSQAGIVYKENGALSLKDGFGNGAEAADDMAMGGLVGACIGILGGPLGVLLGGSAGALIGGSFNAADSLDSMSLMEKVCEALTDKSTSLVALVSEAEEGSFDRFFDKYDAEITCFDAAEVALEIEEAAEMQREMEKEARKKLRAEKRADYKKKLEEKREEIKAKFNEW